MKYVYIILTLALIAAVSAFSLDYWQEQYPLMLEFYDIAFHANATVGMERAGGWSAVNFWAGVGESSPNTYLPFYHIVSLLLLSLGATKFFLAYWWTWAMLPLSFIAVFLFASRAYGARTALYSVMLLALSPVWIEKQWGMPPQALAYVLTPLVLLAVARRRYFIAAILTICCAATHFTGFFLLPFLFIYALHSKEARRPVFIMLGALLLLGSPFVWFVLQRLQHAGLSSSLSGLVAFGSLKEALLRMFSVRMPFHVYMGWLAAAGIVVCYVRSLSFPRSLLSFPSPRKRGTRESTTSLRAERSNLSYAILPSYFLASFPLAMTAHSMRFWTTPALFIFALLGGVALGSVHEWVEGIASSPLAPRNDIKGRSLRAKRSNLRIVFGLAFLILIFLASHALFYYASDRYPQTKIPSLVYLKTPSVWQRPRLTIDADDREKIMRLVRKHVAEDEFFWIDSSNNVNNHIAFETARSTIKSITLEKNALTYSDGIKLVVAKKKLFELWGKYRSGEYALVDNINKEYSAYVLVDAAAAAKVEAPKPLVTMRQLKIGFAAAGLLIVLNFFWHIIFPRLVRLVTWLGMLVVRLVVGAVRKIGKIGTATYFLVTSLGRWVARQRALRRERLKKLRDFRDLEVYKRAYGSGISVMNKIVPNLPDSEKGDLKERLTRVSKEIPRLIAEAYTKRRRKRSRVFRKYLDDAAAECHEAIVCLSQCKDIYGEHIDVKLCEELIKNYALTSHFNIVKV